MRRTDTFLAPPGLSEATAEVYRLCHAPPPAITLATRDPVEFVRLVQSAGGVFQAADVALLAAGAAVGCGFVLAAALSPSGDGLLLLAGLNGLLMVIIAFASGLGAEPAPGRAQADLVGLALVIAPIVAGAWWLSGSLRTVVSVFALAAATAALGRAAEMVNGGLPGRLGLARQWHRPPATFASATIHDAVRRILPRPDFVPERPGHREARPDDSSRAEGWHRVDELARRRMGEGWARAEPMLGRLVPHSGRRPADPEAWGRAAPLARLGQNCDAAALFERAAVLLLPGSPTVPVAAARAWLRSCREPYARVLDLLQASPVLALAITLAPSDLRADRLLARAIAVDPDATLRLDAMSRMGFQRFVAALGVKPVDRGPAGALYLTGFGPGRVALLRVEDRVRGADGAPHVHWLPVPPDMASAGEAVAWTFGKSAREWNPAVET